MTKCEYCGRVIDTIPFKCKICNLTYCEEHRIPEEHMCTHLFSVKPELIFKVGPIFSSGLIERVKSSIDLKNYRLALELLDKVLRKDPDNREAWSLLTQVNILGNQNENTILTCKHFLKKNPNNFEALRTLALTYKEMGEFEKTIKLFEDFKGKLFEDFEGKFEESWHGIILFYNENDQYDKSIRICQDFLNKESRNYEKIKIVWNSLSNTYNSISKYDDAINASNNALEIDPNYYAPLCNRGYAYYKKGVYSEAIKDLIKSLEIYPDNHLGWLYLAQVYKDTKSKNYERIKTG